MKQSGTVKLPSICGNGRNRPNEAKRLMYKYWDRKIMDLRATTLSFLYKPCTQECQVPADELLRTINISMYEFLLEIPRISSDVFASNSFNMCQFLLLFSQFLPLLDYSKCPTETKSATKRVSHLSNFCPNIWMWG